MRELESLLPDLEPPAGGLARLQRSIVSKRRRMRAPGWRWAWAAVVCVLVAVTASWLSQWAVRQQRTHAMLEALSDGVSPRPPAGGIRVADGAAIELPSGQADVRLYLVQAASPRAMQQTAQNDMK